MGGNGSLAVISSGLTVLPEGPYNCVSSVFN